MPWREVLKIMLKKRLAMVCFGIIVVSVIVACSANFIVPDSALSSNAGVDDKANLESDIRAQIAKERAEYYAANPDEAPDKKGLQQEINRLVAEEMEGENLDALTNLERSYQPPGWFLAMSPEHPHWKKTGKDPETKKKNPPMPEAERDWGFFSAKAWRFPMGCDVEGVSILAKLIRGLQLAFIIGVVPTLISAVIATVMGLLAGYFGKWVDDIVIYIVSTLVAIPLLLLLLAFIQAVRESTTIQGWFEFVGLDDSRKAWRNMMLILIVIGITTWTGLCRLVRAEVFKHKDREYVQAARALGYSTPRIMFKHIMPNVFHLVIITFTLGFVMAIGLEVFLSFVGIGVEPELPTWGQMITAGRNELQREPSVWWPLTFATIFLFILSLAFSLFGDALRDALDPKLRT